MPDVLGEFPRLASGFTSGTTLQTGGAGGAIPVTGPKGPESPEDGTHPIPQSGNQSAQPGDFLPFHTLHRVLSARILVDVYYLIIPVGWGSGHGLAGSSVSVSLHKASIKCQPGLWVHLKAQPEEL